MDERRRGECRNQINTNNVKALMMFLVSLTLSKIKELAQAD